AAAAEIQNGVARLQVRRRIAASVVALDHFARYYFEITRIVAHGAAERVLPRGSPGLVALPHYFVNIQLSRHWYAPVMNSRRSNPCRSSCRCQIVLTRWRLTG